MTIQLRRCFFDIFRIAKCGKVILLQIVTDCYYKVRQVLQSVTVITKADVKQVLFSASLRKKIHKSLIQLMAFLFFL